MKYKFRVYSTLSSRLQRAGFSKTGRHKLFPNSGSIANYLYFLFLKNGGVVRKQDLINHKIFDEGQSLTNEFLKCLIKQDFISWDMQENEKNGISHYQVFAARRLSDLLNKQCEEEFATKRDIHQLNNSLTEQLDREFIENMKIKEDITIIQKELKEHRKCIDRLIEKIDPPATEEKYQQYLKE